MDWIKNYILPFAPFITPVVGMIAIYFTFVQYRFQRRLNFIERQLDNLYAPLLACIAYIDAHRHLREDVFKKENEILSQNEIEYVPKLERTDYINRSIAYDNNLFIEKVLPKYKKMLDLFSEQNSCVLPETMQYFENLYRFVEIWERSIADVVHGEVIERINYSEANLHPFYEHVKKTVDDLRHELYVNKSAIFKYNKKMTPRGGR
ncbi:hypothetical protein O9H85_36125 [Paenibacillus filicis]|uniref:LemA family protein n=1 Tax=Paenibacillus gyeongsangnamensis TaxID=3388067 RepID=A0ABT4QLH4_9BACL|nr:hypothetical protein [Paenibacillus filicis]MCZ8517657.1 hypothetical protein [Paenibacillus filicis]